MSTPGSTCATTSVLEAHAIPTLFEPSTRAAIHARIDRLDAEEAAHWERCAHQMVCHPGDQLRVAHGDIKSAPDQSRSGSATWK